VIIIDRVSDVSGLGKMRLKRPEMVRKIGGYGMHLLFEKFHQKDLKDRCIRKPYCHNHRETIAGVLREDPSVF